MKHNKTKPINLKGIIKKTEETEEQLNQLEDPLAAFKWKVSKTVHRNFSNSFSIH